MREFRIAGADSINEQVRIYNEVFEENASVEAWRRKHYKNPLTNEPKLVGAFDEDKLIAINGFLEMRLRYKDVEFKVLQSCDTAVDVNHRKQGLFSAVIKKAMDLYKDEYDALIGFPNFNSHHGFLKLGWEEITRTNKFFLPTNVQRMMKHTKGINLTRLSNLATEIWWLKVRSAAKKAKVIIDKTSSVSIEEFNQYIDKAYIYNNMSQEGLDWKLKALASHYIARRDHEEIAHVLVTKYGYGDGLRRANIVLASYLGQCAKEYQTIMAKILLDLKKEYDLICVWEPKNTEQSRWLRKIGFLRNIVAKEGSPFIMYILTDDEKKRAILSNPENWNPLQTDADFVIDLNVNE